MEFYFESWEVGMFKESQGKLMSVATKIFLIRQTFFSQIYRKLFRSWVVMNRTHWQYYFFYSSLFSFILG